MTDTCATCMWSRPMPVTAPAAESIDHPALICVRMPQQVTIPPYYWCGEFLRKREN